MARDVENALRHEHQALDIARELGDRRLVSEDLAMIGSTYAESEDYDHAVPYFEEALAIDRSLDPRDSLGGLLGMLAQACHYSGEYAKAIQHYEEAIAIERERLPAISLLTYYMNDLGRVHLALGNKQQGIQCFEESLQIIRNNGEHQAEYSQLTNMVLAFGVAAPELAMNYAQQGLTFARQKGDYRAIAQALQLIAEIYFRAGNHEQSFSTLTDVVAIVRQNNDTLIENHTLYRLSGMHKQLGHTQEAASYMKQGMLLRANNDKYKDSFSQFSLAGIFEDEGDFAAALHYAQRALNYFIEQQESADDAAKQSFEHWVKKAQDRIASIRQKLDLSDK